MIYNVETNSIDKFLISCFNVRDDFSKAVHS